MLKFVTLAAAVAFSATPLAAQVSSTETAPQAVKSHDPAKLICEREEQIGSRLGARRICLTAAQWDEQRREHRADIERAQRNVGIRESH